MRKPTNSHSISDQGREFHKWSNFYISLIAGDDCSSFNILLFLTNEDSSKCQVSVRYVKAYALVSYADKSFLVP